MLLPEAAEQQHPLLDGKDDLPPIEDRPMLEYFVIKQEVNLEVNFRDRRLDGTTDIFIVTFTDKIDEILLDAAHCEIDTNNVTVTEMREVQGEAVEGQKRKASAEYNDPYLKLSQPKGWNLRADHHDLRRIRARSVFHSRKTDVPAENREFEGCTPVYGSLKKVYLQSGAPEKSHKQYKITIPFTNTNPRDGLHFIGVDALDNRFTHMYTRHSIQPGTASCIFPCIDDHGARCDWRISIKYPRTLGDALQQALATQKDGHSHGSGDKMQIDSYDRQDRHTRLAEEDKLREMSVVCSGFLMEESVDPEDDRKKILVFEPEKKVSVQKLGFAVGPFEHIDLSSEFRTEEDEVKLGMSALKVHAYCLPHRGDWVRNTAAALTMAADFFTYTFAKYPFGNFKICFLDDLVEDTVALHSLAFISNRLLFPEDIIDTEIDVTRKIVHTLTYQWIGINMIPNTRNDLWLVIGIAHYMTDLFMKRLCGNNEYRFRMKTLADKLVEADIDRPSLFDLGPSLHLGEFEMEFMRLKAPVVFFILDKRLSKASGGHGLTRILQKLLTKVQIESSDRSTILDTEKFKATCEKAVKYRLESFWNQWIYNSGCPRFDVKAKFNKKRLCVELTLNQVQHQTAKRSALQKEDFLRVIKERRADLKIGEIQPLFTGPMTVRIHEADGTPYEHILEIREDATRSTKFEIPYNTKYKRLKRTRRMKEKHNAGASIEVAENADDALLYCLGDVLQSAEDQRDWELIDWDPDTERKMDQESYEWIRVDADFEWACGMNRTLEPYMYVSQLQQDRDVVAQQDAMLYLAQGPLHPIASGFLVRTLIDRRYFHGIRTMAAEALTRQANIKDIPMLGLRQLLRAFREMFCYDQTNQPRQNDFSDKKQYNVRCAIIKAIAEVRDPTSRCPFEARRFILDQLLFNNNEDNPFSDHFYIATLVEALATSLIPSQQDDWFQRQSKIPTDEERGFLEEALEQIERVLRRDEWTHSYQNIWTIAGLDAKQRLMKAEVIPKNYADFGQYLLDGTRDLIRIKCFESLIDLGAMMDPTVFTFLLYSLMTDRSPFVRNKLVQAMARGLAAIAFGEYSKDVKSEPLQDEADALLLVQDSAEEIAARKEKFARKENLDAALKALRREMEETYGADERHYSTAMRKALDHQGLGRGEVENLLDLATMMFEEARGWVLTLNLPKAWKVERPAQQLADRLIVNFKSYYKTKLKGPSLPPPPPPQEIKPPPPVQRTPSIKINMKSSQPPKPSQTPKPAPMPKPTHTPKLMQPPKPSLPSAKPAIPSKPAQLPKPASLPKFAQLPRPTPPPKPTPPLQRQVPTSGPTQGNTIIATPSVSRPSNGPPSKVVIKTEHHSGGILSKRPRPDKSDSLPPASKRPKTEQQTSSADRGLGATSTRHRRIVTLKTRNPKRLAVILGKSLGSSASSRTALPGGPAKEYSGGHSRDGITVKPIRKPLPTGEVIRKPLPGSSHLPTPPSTNKVLVKPHSSSTSLLKGGTPPAALQTGASTGRPKIKIIRKPQPQKPSAP
ncbi:Transcription initiation factor TFIID subunit 2 [Cladobotryum mycophilum]|uniref:Transcription initiation factor TFIID subunit 2 n=1 Tax=Cladobotryum mycophilum TaxID=491253 RepID=A0ABR0SK17_9HYPO